MSNSSKQKKILIIDGHPNEESLCRSLAEAYNSSARSSGFDSKILNIRDLKFELNLRKGYREIQELEPDLVDAQKQIKECEHLVLVYPMWWGTMPALLKGFFDRALLPGFAFKYHKSDPLWDKLLSGRSARIIVTSDAPYIYNLIAYLNAPYRVMRKTILGFCGFKPVELTAIGGVKNFTENNINKTIEKVRALGAKGK